MISADQAAEAYPLILDLKQVKHAFRAMRYFKEGQVSFLHTYFKDGASYKEPQCVTFAVPAESIHNILLEKQKNLSERLTRLGVNPETVTID